MTETPVHAEATAMAFAQDGAPQNDPTFLNSGSLAMVAINLPQIVWTFDETAKVYNGAAPYGSFVLSRDAGSKRLYVDFKSTDGSHSSRMGMTESSVGPAKAVVLVRLLESLNQSRRLDLIVPTKLTETPAVPAEPDLI